MADERVVILGGKGMLGSDLVGVCRARGFETVVFDLPEFDITNEQQLKDAVKDVGVIINCAAYTNVDGAESESELAQKVNAEAVGRLGALAAESGAWVLHVSTDFVFDGESDSPYVEADSPNPVSAYGASKLAGERLLIESGCGCCIIRVEWTYGLGGNNFVAKLVSLAKQGKALKVIDDQIGSPTATTEVAKVIVKLLEMRVEGMFHFASFGYVSRFEMAKFIFDKLDIPVELSSCKSSEYVTAAKRPLNSCFDCSKIVGLLGEPIKPWQEPLEEFLRQL
ncbi:MAG: dTDP-4-dehydrorhamnose reductase [Planctomycetes bacterium]|nr:dTDP-4-dehydrorhamnose reductase [Planctomycetota bacterium]